MDKKNREIRRQEYQEFYEECFNNVSQGPSGDRAMAVLAAAFLDEKLYEMLETYFVEDSAKDILDKIVDKLDSRIQVAYGVGLIGPEMRRDLDLVRKIRNEFAHSLHGRSFADDDIANRCRELRACDLTDIKNVDPRSRFASSAFILSTQIALLALSVKRQHAAKDFSLGGLLSV